MRDQQDGVTFAQQLKGRSQPLLCQRIQRRGRLVQNKQWHLAHQGAQSHLAHQGAQSLLDGAARLRAWFHERRSWCPIHLTISSSPFGAECAFTSSGLAVRPNGDQAYICLAPTSPLTDVSITVQQTSGSPTHAFGIAFRHAAPESYYFFGIDGRGRFTSTAVVNDVSHTVIPFTPKAAIHTGANARNQL